MSNCWTFAVLSVALSTGAARAVEPTPGPGASLRVGYAGPMGSISPDPRDGLAATFGGQLPLQLDVGYRVTPEVALAIYAQYAFGAVGPEVGGGQQGLRCSARDLRLGMEVFWHFLPGHDLDPWVAAGLGWEWATVAAHGSGAPVEVTLSGWELANAQAGADLPLGSAFSIGPFVQLTVATYSSATGSPPVASGGVLGGAVHEWLQLGIRGSFGL